VSDDDVKDSFYTQLHATLDLIPKSDALVVLGDFNARVGCDNALWPGILGPHGVGEMTDNGERLLNMCSVYQLSVMGTRFPHRQIHLWTDEP